jgi:5-methylcytosine-specific restriction enzyme B
VAARQVRHSARTGLATSGLLPRRARPADTEDWARSALRTQQLRLTRLQASEQIARLRGMGERDTADVWAEVQDKARDRMLTETPVLTIDRSVTNFITEVGERGIFRKSDEPRGEPETESRITQREIADLWQQLEERGETYRAGPIAFTYALLADTVPGVEGISGPLRLYFSDRTAAERTWLGSVDAGRVRLLNAVGSLRTHVIDEGPTPHKPLTVLLLLERYQEGAVPATLGYVDDEPNFLELIRTVAPEFRNASWADPFWRLRTSGIWTINPPGPFDNPDPAPTYLRDNNCTAAFTTEVDAALRNDPDLVAMTMDEIITRYFGETAATLLRTRFDITPSQHGPSLRECLETTLHAVHAAHNAPSREATQQVRKQLEAKTASAVRQLIRGSGWQVRASAGLGTAAAVPWVAIFPPGKPPSARAGVYLVYLIAADGSAAYLTVGQGADQLKGGTAALSKRSLDLRAASVPAPGGALTTISLRSTVPRARRYEAATVYARRYDAGQIPRDGELVQDFTEFQAVLQRILGRDIDLPSEIEPVHILFKWNADREPRTVRIHEDLARQDRAVWWGRPGGQSRRALAPARLADISEQLSAGTPTHVYLYRRTDAWRADLLAITDDPRVVQDDEAPLPSYYQAADCNMFVKITNLAPVSDDTIRDGLLLATNPNPEVWQGALSNQTNPLLVYERLELHNLIAGETPPGPPEPVREELTIEWLEDQTYWDRDRLEELLSSLTDRSPQIVLAGPPGTGKTYVADCVARYLTGDAPLARRTVQFHPTYGYEEFVEGLRPVLTEKEQLVFRPASGVVVSMVKEDMEGTSDPHVLIIDEMNRANIPRVFGELLYLLEYRDQPINLLYTENFELPSNLHIIGTMNTADRSIRSIDIALRRRFDFFECQPDSRVLERHYGANGRGMTEVDGLVTGFLRLNDKLTELLDRHRTIGHSYFMQEHYTVVDLHRVWRHQIIPLLEDYFFDEPDIVDDFEIGSFWPDAT